MDAPRWFTSFWGRFSLNAHVEQIVDACSSTVWERVQARVGSMSPHEITGYTRARAGAAIRGVVRDHSGKYGLQAVENKLLDATLERLVSELIQRNAVPSSNYQERRAA